VHIEGTHVHLFVSIVRLCIDEAVRGTRLHLVVALRQKSKYLQFYNFLCPSELDDLLKLLSMTLWQ